MSLTKLASCLAAGALAMTACSPAGGSATSNTPGSGPELPEVVEFAPSLPVAPGDGLHHVIVTPTPDAFIDDANPYEADSVVVTAGAAGASWQLDSSVMASFPPGAELVLDEGQLRVRLPDGSIVEPTMPAVSLGHPAIDQLAQVEGVEKVTPIGDGSFAVAVTDPAVLAGMPVTVADDPLWVLAADPYERYQWTLDNTGNNFNGLAVNPMPVFTADVDIDGLEARSVATGSGVVVAVIDSGVDFSHPDLAAARWNNPNELCGNGVDDDGNGFIDDCYGWDFAYEDSTPFNAGAHPHGTHVAGIIAATAGNGVGIAGVAPDAKVMDLNVGVTTASGPSISTSAIARAVRYAADNGADVINLSLGTPPGTPRSAMTTVESAINHAGNLGVLVVIAAGNDNVSLASTTVWPASYEGDHILTVAAAAPDGTKASFSNYGGGTDIFAPGHYILSTTPAANGSYQFMSGTSQAAPTVAAAAALVLQTHPSSSPGAVAATLINSADRVQAYLPYVDAGVSLNAANAVGLGSPTVDLDHVAVTVDGLTGAMAGDQIAAELDIAVPADAYDEGYGWEATLYVRQGADTYAVVGHELVIDGTLRATNDRGTVTLGATGSTTASLVTQLPAGEYALMLEAVPDADPSSRLGEPFVATFLVQDPASPTTTTPSTSTTQAPGALPSPPLNTTSTTTTWPSAGTTPPPATAGPVPPGSSGPATTTTGAPTQGGPAPAPTPTTTTTATSTTSPPSSGWPTTTAGPAPLDPPSAPPTTEAPSTSPPAPGPTPPPSTSPTTTVPPAPTTTMPSGPVSSGEWSIESISPATGAVSTYTAVQLRGTFPESVYVWFGDQPGIVGYQSATSLTVLTPLRQDAGTVDISLRRTGQGTVLTVPGGFVFTSDVHPSPTPSEPSPSPTPSEPSPSPSPPSTPTTAAPWSPTPTTTAAPSAPPTTTASPTTTAPVGSGGAPPTSTTTAAAPTPTPAPTTAPAPFPSRTPRSALGSTVVQLDNGLQAVAVQDSSPFNSAPFCSTNPCSMT